MGLGDGILKHVGCKMTEDGPELDQEVPRYAKIEAKRKPRWL